MNNQPISALERLAHYFKSPRVYCLTTVLGAASAVKTLLPADKLDAIEPWLGLWCLVGFTLSLLMPNVLKRVVLFAVRPSPKPLLVALVFVCCYALAVTPTAKRVEPGHQRTPAAVEPVPVIVDEAEEPNDKSQYVQSRVATLVASVVDRRPDFVSGTVTSPNSLCASARGVRLVPTKIAGSPSSQPAQIVRARTDEAGRWRTERPLPHVRYTLEVPEIKRRPPGQAPIQCRALSHRMTLVATAHQPSTPSAQTVITDMGPPVADVDTASSGAELGDTGSKPASSSAGTERETDGNAWGEGETVEPLNHE
jgi:hypothetical protein